MKLAQPLVALTTLSSALVHVEAQGYGPLSPKKDAATGLELLQLPDGFTYTSFGWTGQIMTDGNPTPTDHDGMAVVGQIDKDTISMVRNHELAPGECIPTECADTDCIYSELGFGGTTTLFFNFKNGKWVESFGSLGGTFGNCAGAGTPWETWISMEESWTFPDEGPVEVGWIYEVPKDGASNAIPIKSAGRFVHEAGAVDPSTGILYETEDLGVSAIYKYVPPGEGPPYETTTCVNNAGEEYECLADGGTLYYLVATGNAPTFEADPDDDLEANFVFNNGLDLRGGFENGQTFSVEWKPVGDPQGKFAYPLQTAPDAAIFRRGEGAWWSKSEGKLYFISTSSGAVGQGKVWSYNPSTETLTMVFESPDAEILSGPDNMVVHQPSGNLLLCEDGGSNPKRLIGLTIDNHEVFELARNNVILTEGDIDKVDAVYPGVKDNFLCDDPVGSYTSREFAGATFYGKWLFVNIQSPGITFAITGPWNRGAFFATGNEKNAGQ